MFLEYYENAIKNGENYHLTERHKDVSPILIDFDFKFNLEHKERQYNETHIIEIIKLYNKEIKNIFKIDEEDDKLTSFVFQREKPYQSKGIIKDGLHIMYPYIVCEPNVQHYIRKCVLKNTRHERSHHVVTTIHHCHTNTRTKLLKYFLGLITS